MVGQDKGVNYNLETRFLLIIRDLRIECQNTDWIGCLPKLMDPNASNVLMYHDMPTEGNPISDDACVCYMRVRQRKREYQSRG